MRYNTWVIHLIKQSKDNVVKTLLIFGFRRGQKPWLMHIVLWLLMLFYGKKWKQWIFQKLLQPVTWKLEMQTTNWDYEGMWVLKVKVISLLYIIQVLYVLCFTRPRNQVSVYRTIGPLVSINRSLYWNWAPIFNIIFNDIKWSSGALLCEVLTLSGCKQVYSGGLN